MHIQYSADCYDQMHWSKMIQKHRIYSASWWANSVSVVHTREIMD